MERAKQMMAEIDKLRQERSYLMAVLSNALSLNDFKVGDTDPTRKAIGDTIRAIPAKYEEAPDAPNSG